MKKFRALILLLGVICLTGCSSAYASQESPMIEVLEQDAKSTPKGVLVVYYTPDNVIHYILPNETESSKTYSSGSTGWNCLKVEFIDNNKCNLIIHSNWYYETVYYDVKDNILTIYNSHLCDELLKQHEFNLVEEE